MDTALRAVPQGREEKIRCYVCDGHGIVSTWSFGVKEPDECSTCFGNGELVVYSNGGLAVWRGGPMVGRLSK